MKNMDPGGQSHATWPPHPAALVLFLIKDNEKFKAYIRCDCECWVDWQPKLWSPATVKGFKGVIYSHFDLSPLVPCAAQNVSAVKECGADAITMTWTMSGSAIFYVAMAKDSNGVIYSCNSIDLSCKIEGLKCSTNYTAYVIASNFVCNSSESEMVAIETGTVRLLVFCLGCLLGCPLKLTKERGSDMHYSSEGGFESVLRFKISTNFVLEQYTELVEHIFQKQRIYCCY